MATEFSFTFTVPGASNREAAGNSGFFGHRTPSTWLDDLARCAGIPLTVTEDDFLVERVTVHGSEDALRFACVAFNLHAEQAPWDTTPVEQGAALERVLSGAVPADDGDLVVALQAAGFRAFAAYTPSRVSIVLHQDESGHTEVLLTSAFNREDGGWEAALDTNGDQYGLEDGPGLNASTEEVVAWVLALQAGGWTEF